MKLNTFEDVARFLIENNGSLSFERAKYRGDKGSRIIMKLAHPEKEPRERSFFMSDACREQAAWDVFTEYVMFMANKLNGTI